MDEGTMKPTKIMKIRKIENRALGHLSMKIEKEEFLANDMATIDGRHSKKETNSVFSGLFLFVISD
jgi:hypothetical protein